MNLTRSFIIFISVAKRWRLRCEMRCRRKEFVDSRVFMSKQVRLNVLLIWRRRGSIAVCNENESVAAYFRQGNDLEMKFTRRLTRGWIVIESRCCSWGCCNVKTNSYRIPATKYEWHKTQERCEKEILNRIRCYFVKKFCRTFFFLFC